MPRMSKEERQQRRAERKERRQTDPEMIFLTKKQESFIDFYCDKDKPETYLKAKSALNSAGYSNVTATLVKEMLSNHRVKWGMTCWMEKHGKNNEITRQKVLEMLLVQYNKADESDDRANAIRAAELLGKSISMFSDKLMITTDQQHLIDDTLRREASALAQARMANILDGESTVIGEFEPNPAISDEINENLIEEALQNAPQSQNSTLPDPQDALLDEMITGQ